MISVLHALGFLLEWCYGFVFFWILQTFLPLRESRFVRILAFLLCGCMACVIVYANDLDALLGAMLGFVAYVAVFHRGSRLEKLTAVLVFYPAVIAINYLMRNIGSELFFRLTGAPSGIDMGWTSGMYLMSTVIYTTFLALRLLFWLGTWALLGKYLKQISAVLTRKLWLMIDALMLAPVVAIFTVLYFLPERAAIAYPICGAAVFSSFGGIYFVSYLCSTVQTACRAQELEQKQAYWQDRLRDEERIRSIYHDMKNHLLVLQTRTDHPQEVMQSIQTLQEQISDFESYIHTGNDFLDILLRDKAQIARQKQIDFSAVIQLEDVGFLTPLDISTIFGNALDNAIEASEKLPQELRLITAKASRIRDMLVITVENSMLPGPAAGGRTSKQDPFVHGFGLPNIRKAVEKYGGQCKAETSDGRFVLKIVIPIPG